MNYNQYPPTYEEGDKNEALFGKKKLKKKANQDVGG